MIKFCLLTLFFFSDKVLSLNYEKSYLINNDSSPIYSFAFDQDYLYVPVETDIVQKELSSGNVVKTLRGNDAKAIDVLLLNATLVAGFVDGEVVQWNLTSGLITNRMNTNCDIKSFLLFYEWLIVSCSSTAAKAIDFKTGQLIYIFEDAPQGNEEFYLYGNEVYGYFNPIGLITYQKTFSRKLMYTDAGALTACVRNDMSIFVADYNSFKIMEIDALSSSLSSIFTGSGHYNFVFVFSLSGQSLISGGQDGLVILWNITEKDQVRMLNCFVDSVQKIVFKNATSLLIGGTNGDIALYDLVKDKVVKFYRGKVRSLLALAVYKDLVISGGLFTPLVRWSISTGLQLPSFQNNSFAGGQIFITENILISCFHSIVYRDLNTNFLVKNFAYMQVYCENTFYFYNGFLFAPAYTKTNKYNFSDATLVLQFQDSQVNTVITSSIAVGNYYFSNHAQNLLIQWDSNSGQLQHKYPLYYFFGAFTLYDNNLLFSGGPNVYLLNPTTFESSVFHNYDAFIYTMLYDQQSSSLFIGDYTGAIKGLDLKNDFQVIYIFQGHTEGTLNLVVDGDSLFSCSVDGTVKKWSLLTKRIVYTFEDRSLSVMAVVDFNDNLLFGTLGGSLLLFQISTAYYLYSLDLLNGAISDIAATNFKIFVASRDETISIWNKTSLEFISMIEVHTVPNSIFINHDYLFSGNTDECITQWNIANATVVKRFVGHGSNINSILVDENVLFSGGSDGVICRWNLDQVTIEQRYKGHSDQITSLLIKGSNLLSSSLDKSVIMWDIISVKVVYTFRRAAYVLGHIGPINQIRLCNGFMVSASSDLSIKLWNLESKSLVTTLFGHTKPVTSFSCTNRDLFSGSEDNSVLKWKPFGFISLTVISTENDKPTSKNLMSNKDAVRMFNGTGLNLLLIILCIILVIVIIAVIFVTKKVFLHSKDSLLDTSFLKSNTALTSARTMFTQILGMAVPGYLEMQDVSFQLGKQIGKGGAGSIHVVKLMNIDGIFAAKVFHCDFDELNSRKKLLFDQEISIMDYLKENRNICKVVGFCRKPCCIIMKFYEKGSLDTLIYSSNRYSRKVLIYFLTNISNGLSFMHFKKLAHCDLKPLNILIDVDNNGPFLVLTDFGISMVLEQSIIAAQLLNVIHLKGISFQYAAPEVFARFRNAAYQEPDVVTAGDVYSFAIVLLELVSRVAPWRRY